MSRHNKEKITLQLDELYSKIIKLESKGAFKEAGSVFKEIDNLEKMLYRSRESLLRL